MTNPPPLPVSEAAREAAADLSARVQDQHGNNIIPTFGEAILRGEIDTHAFVQAFARFEAALQSPPAASQDGAGMREALETQLARQEKLITQQQARADQQAEWAQREAANCVRLERALESIREYWNRDQNEAAMADACWHAINTADEALAALHQGELQQGSDFYANLYAQMCGRIAELESWATGSRIRLDELIQAASGQWGAGSEQHNLVRDVSDALFREYPNTNTQPLLSTPPSDNGQGLRAALIECGRAVGAALSDDVSNDFLLNVPEEVRLKIAALSPGQGLREALEIDEHFADFIREGRAHASDMPAVIQRDYLLSALDKLERIAALSGSIESKGDGDALSTSASLSMGIDIKGEK